MRAKDFITEAFDRPYAFNWSRGDHGDYDILVKLPDGTSLNISFNHEGDNIWHVAFDRGYSQEITGEGDAQRIFATVLTSIQQFIIKQDPDRLYFSASKDVEPGQNSESRARLYERMVNRYAAAMGYDVVVDDRRGHTMFILDKEQGLTEEEFNGIDIDMEVEGDEIMVTAMANGRELGHVLFVDEGEYLMPQDLEVDERFQGQGIAAAMYDYVKSKGYKIRRSGQQTDAGAGFWGKHRPEQNVWESTADDINKMFNNMYDPMTTNLQRVALMAMQGRQDEAVMQLNRVIKDASPEAQKKITDAVNNIKPVTVNGKIADSSTLDKSKQHQDWILNTFIPWVQSLLDKQGMTEEQQSTPTMGINVRSDGDIDYAGLIIDGRKKYESRQTDSLRPYVGKTVAIVRTGKGSAVAIGQVTVGEPVVVDAEKFDKMRKQHLVPQGSKFDIGTDATKYLYPMIDPIRWDREKLVKQKGIVARKIDEGTESTNHVLFLGPDAVIVGQEHGKPLKLSDQEQQKIRVIAERHGAWYEGNGMDQKHTKGIIDDYRGSWDDDLLSPKIKGYPAPFLYVLFSNIKENDTVEGKIGFDPNSTIFDRILDTQPSANYFPDRRFDAETLQKFLKSVSEDRHDFVRMSQAPATEQNVRKFFTLGERLMFPDNWEEYPYRAGRVAKSVNDLRDKFLATRKKGVYVAGSDHLQAVQQFLDQNKQGVAEGQDDNGISFQIQKGKNKFATTLSIGNNSVGVYQYDANTGRSIAEVYPEFKGKGLGKLLVLHAIYTAAKLGLDFQEDESRTSEYDNVLDSLSSNGYIVDDDGYWYVTGEGEQFLKQSLKQGVAEGLVYEADASAVQFRTASTDNYQSSFTVTAIADGKNVGHFSFFRDPETDDVHNQAEVTDDIRGKGYGKALLLKAIEVANDHGLGFQEDSQSLSRAQSRVYDSLYDAGWIVDADGYWFLTPEGEQELVRLSTIQQGVTENFADGKVKGKSRPGRVKRAGASCNGSVTDLRARAKNASGEKAKMYHWCANMKSGKKK